MSSTSHSPVSSWKYSISVAHLHATLLVISGSTLEQIVTHANVSYCLSLSTRKSRSCPLQPRPSVVSSTCFSTMPAYDHVSSSPAYWSCSNWSLSPFACVFSRHVFLQEQPCRVHSRYTENDCTDRQLEVDGRQACGKILHEVHCHESITGTHPDDLFMLTHSAWLHQKHKSREEHKRSCFHISFSYGMIFSLIIMSFVFPEECRFSASLFNFFSHLGDEKIPERTCDVSFHVRVNCRMMSPGILAQLKAQDLKPQASFESLICMFAWFSFV